MKKLLFSAAMLLAGLSANAQLDPGSVAPNFTVSANQLVRFDLEAFSSSNKIMADAGDTLVLENVDKASAVKARILVTFEDATPANNYFTITNSDGDNQTPQYFIEEGWVRITKIS